MIQHPVQRIRLLAALLLLALGSILMPATGSAEAASNSATDLAGIWGATRRFGPEMRGNLTLTRQDRGWQVEIAGFTVDAYSADTTIEFEIPGDRGRFQGQLHANGQTILGHWIQPPTVNNGLRFASPVELASVGKDRWQGEVVPWEDELTFYLVLKPRDDGSVGAFFRNPERNLGVFLNLDRVERKGDRVELIGTGLNNKDERLLAEGTYYPDFERLSIFISRGNGTYDFERIDDDPASFFYPRGQTPGSYHYRPPPPRDDGWSVGTLQEADISVEPIRKLIETEIFPPPDSLHDVYVHGMLIARHGKLVLEEYFHGFSRGTPHDTRSASKSLTATLLGAAIQAGEPLTISSPVYETIYGEALDPDIDPRKKRMTVENLLTMASGFDCDDRDSSSPGSEDVMQEQTEEPDWYRYTLALPMAREPGAEAIYCSAGANLLGAVLSQATGETLPRLFHRLIAEPLDIERYHLTLQPTGEPYMGGGIHWLPRDFMKLGQLYLDGGLWNGKRVLGAEFTSRATEPLFELRERRYGYLWWVVDYPYKGGSVRAFFAGGNGGQVVIGFPDLDLLVTFFAGNYNDRVLYRMQDEFVPDYILPAVDSIGE
jgi:CubicO group peptidase (beta-lactamase class C family)